MRDQGLTMTKSRRQVNMRACAKGSDRWALILSKLREAQSLQVRDGRFCRNKDSGRIVGREKAI